MDMETLSIAGSFVSIVLGVFAICVSYHFYSKNKVTEQNLMILVTEIKTRTETVQGFVGSQYDTLLSHSLKPDPMSEKLLALLTTGRSLPTAPLPEPSESGPQSKEFSDLLVRWCYACLNAGAGYSLACMLIARMASMVNRYRIPVDSSVTMQFYQLSSEQVEATFRMLRIQPPDLIEKCGGDLIFQSLKDAKLKTTDEIRSMFEWQKHAVPDP